MVSYPSELPIAITFQLEILENLVEQFEEKRHNRLGVYDDVFQCKIYIFLQ